MKNWIGRFVFAVLLGGFVLLMGYIIFPTRWTSNQRGSPAFDAEKWKMHDSRSTSSYRWCAVDDLLARHRLIGMKKDEVVALLGPPTGYMGDGVKGIDYYLAPQPFVDSWWLVLELDESGTVTNHYIGGD
jgi:hypothetical protein